MPSRIAATRGAPHRTAAATIDVKRHADGLRDAAAEVRQLVERLTNGKQWLFSHTASDPERPEAERLWSDLQVRLHEALRSVYARWALLRVALSHEDAIGLWQAEMPTQEAMDEIGIADMLVYWRSRNDPPAWITTQEMMFVTKNMWPPVYGADAIQGGIEEMYEPPPF